MTHIPNKHGDAAEQDRQLRGPEIQDRLARESARLKQHLMQVYDGHSDLASWTDRLLACAKAFALDRPSALWQLDLRRQQDPDWFLSGKVAYCAYADKFAGTLRGVTERIPHLQELGVSYLHLLPFLKAGERPNDGGFAVASYEEIEPALGDLNDLQHLTAALRQADISLCSDFVLNHVSHDHAWARQALAGDARYQGYFHWRHSPEEVAHWERHLGQVFPATAPGNFTYQAALDAWVWTTFYPFQWDLNYGNPEVFEEIVKALLKLANLGVEVFRLDSTGFLWKREGTSCANQPQVHHLLQALRCLVNIAAPGILLKAEAIMPTRDLPPYFGLGAAQAEPECHLAYHSSLMSAAWVGLSEQKAQLVEDVLANTPPLPAGCGWMTYVRCHDDIGWNVLRPELSARGDAQFERLTHASQFFAGRIDGSYARGESFQASDPNVVHGTNGMTAALVGLSNARTPQEAALAESRYLLLHGLSLFVGGLPLIYMGDECAMGNVTPQELAARQGDDGRELHRPLFDDQAFAARHDPETSVGRIFEALCAMVRLRCQEPSFHGKHAVTCRPSGHPAVLRIERAPGLCGLFNFSEEAVDLGALASSCQPQDVLIAHPGAAENTLPAYGMRWVKNRSDARKLVP